MPGDRVTLAAGGTTVGIVVRGPFGWNDLCEVRWGVSDGKPVLTKVPAKDLRHVSR